MTVFTCGESFESMMTCIYDAWSAGLGHGNVRLEREPVMQQELFCDYRHVDADEGKADKVSRSIRNKISWEAWRQVFMAAHSDQPDRLDAVYRFLILGFHVGRKVTSMLTEACVMRILELGRRTGNEMHFFREFTRFTSLNDRVFAAHIEPKCNIIAMTAEHFADRMPSEHWIMIDDGRQLAVIHPADGEMYLRYLTREEFQRLRETEKVRDDFTALWEEFFRTTAIRDRENPLCQRQMMPLRYRKHVTEFLHF